MTRRSSSSARSFEVVDSTRLEQGDELQVYGRLAARELDDLGMTLELDEPVEHRFDFLYRQIEARAGIGEADRAIQRLQAVFTSMSARQVC